MPAFRLRRRSLIAATAAASFAPAIGRAAERTLRFVPHTSLTSLDATWSNALISYHHAFMVFDTLFGVDANLTPRHQMLAGHELSEDRRTWRFTLRDGLAFHDGEPVRSRDCIASIRRWALKDLFGLHMANAGWEMREISDRVFEIVLARPFSLLPFALGGTTCFIMPERIAVPDMSRGIREAIGSGPFRFLANEWDSGSHVAYARNERYQPRQEAPDVYAGGKMVHFDRVEWKILPDPQTATNALLKGEVDWLERPHPDHLPTLRKTRGITVEKLDPFGWMGMLQFNQRRGPLDNPMLRRAILTAMDQREYMQAVVGDYPELWKTPVGWFTGGTPYAGSEGIEALLRGPNIEAARQLVKQSGYDGQKVVHLAAGDIPVNTAMGLMTAELYKRIGLNVEYTSIDWGVLVGRVNNPDPNNNWASFCSGWTGLATSNPGSHRPLAGNVPNPKMEALRAEWLEAPDEAAQKQVATRMQILAGQEPPSVPFGQYFLPNAFRSNLSGFTPAAVVAFWGVQRA